MPDAPAWRSSKAWAVLVSVVVLGLVADLGSKWWAFRSLGPAPVVVDRAEVLRAGDLGSLIPFPARREIVPGILDFTLVLNRGAVFGMAAGKRAFFIAFTCVAVGLGMWMFARWTTRRDTTLHAAIGLVLSGGLGNLYDRLVFACVRDFIHPLPGVMLPFGWSWPWGGREVWPYVSNVADLWLLVGIGVLLVAMLKAPPPTAEARPGSPSGA